MCVRIKQRREPTIKDTPLKELAEWSLTAWDDDHYFRTTCSACGEGFDGPSHVGDWHRFTPLCEDCYYDEAANIATSYKIKDRGHRNAPETEFDNSGPLKLS